jgi:CheY-like chemotaxis protein
MTKTLIVVDDNEQFAKIISDVAKRRNWDCSIYRNGQELIDHFHEVSLPALLLLDILMPQLDGIETLPELLKKNFRQLRVRFMTGGDPSNAAAANIIALSLTFNTGATLYKPITIEELDCALMEEERHLRSLKSNNP